MDNTNKMDCKDKDMFENLLNILKDLQKENEDIRKEYHPDNGVFSDDPAVTSVCGKILRLAVEKTIGRYEETGQLDFFYLDREARELEHPYDAAMVALIDDGMIRRIGSRRGFDLAEDRSTTNYALTEKGLLTMMAYFAEPTPIGESTLFMGASSVTPGVELDEPNPG